MNEIEKKRYLDCKYLDAGMDGMLCSMDMCTTCKEFNGENCSHYVSKNEIEQKQIEEIAKVIAKRDCYLYGKCPKEPKHNCKSLNPELMLESSKNYITIARWLVEAHYRNCKNKVVLTEREHEIAMKNQYDVGFRFGYKKMQEELAKTSELKVETIKLAEQKMAKNIKNKFRELLSQYCEKMSRDFAFKILDETIEQCGVNIEE